MFSIHRYILPLPLLLLCPLPSDGQIIATNSECQHASDCVYPNNECCFYKEYTSQFSVEANTFFPIKRVSGKCCYRGSGGANGAGDTFPFGGGGGDGMGNGGGGSSDLGGGGSSYGGYYRFSSWNMWYFWFLIIFLLLSCLGVCGYWRRRQWMLSFQNSHRALPLGHQQQPQQQPPQRHHHHHHQLPLTHPLSLTMGGGAGITTSTLRASPLPVSSAARSQQDYVTGLTTVTNPPPNHPHHPHHHHLQHPADPRNFVAPPDFNLYAAHAAIRASPMFAPGPTRIANQLYANPSPSCAPSAAAIGAAASAANVAQPPTLLLTPIVPANGASISGVIGSGDGMASPGLPPSYVEAVSGAADAKQSHAAGFSNAAAREGSSDKKMEDLPPSYAEAVAQMLQSPLQQQQQQQQQPQQHHSLRAGMNPAGFTSRPISDEASSSTLPTRVTPTSLASSSSTRMATTSLFPRSVGTESVTSVVTTTVSSSSRRGGGGVGGGGVGGGGGAANLVGIYDPITSLTRSLTRDVSGGENN